MRHRNRVLTSTWIAPLALGTLVLGLAATARADEVVISSNCVYRTNTDCVASCSDVDLSAVCTGSADVDCKGKCTLDPEAVCTEDCQKDCTTQCTKDPATVECTSYCQTDCSANCESACSADGTSASCMTDCQAGCDTDCGTYCETTPAEIECDTQCTRTCDATCRVEAELDCKLACNAEISGSCDLESAAIECTTQCGSGEGILVCDGQARTYGSEENARTYYSTQIEARDVDVSGTVNCSSLPGAPGASAFAFSLLLGLGGVIAMRRRPR